MFVGMIIENYSEGMVEKAGMFDERMEILKMFNHQTMRLFPGATTELKWGVPDLSQISQHKAAGIVLQKMGCDKCKIRFQFPVACSTTYKL